MYSKRISSLLFTLYMVNCGTYEVEYGRYNYSEYHPGSKGSNIIITSSHGGTIKPSDLPTRTDGCYIDGECVWNYNCGAQDSDHCSVRIISDLNTKSIAIVLRDELEDILGERPHLILMNLHRSRIDANREIGEATLNNSIAKEVWHDFHNFILLAKSEVETHGLLVDMHGQSHSEDWIELGYLISRSRLDSFDYTASISSVHSLADRLDISMTELLTGAHSLGGMIENDLGYKVVPSPSYPGPNGGNYYSGGYITKTYGSKYLGDIDAIQMELPRTMRDSDTYAEFAVSIAQSIAKFSNHFYSIETISSTDATSQFYNTLGPTSASNGNTETEIGVLTTAAVRDTFSTDLYISSSHDNNQDNIHYLTTSASSSAAHLSIRSIRVLCVTLGIVASVGT